MELHRCTWRRPGSRAGTDLLVPFETQALRVINPNVHPLEIPDRAMLRIVADGDVLDAAMVVVGGVPAATATEHAAPATGRDAWRPIVDADLADDAIARHRNIPWLLAAAELIPRVCCSPGGRGGVSLTSSRKSQVRSCRLSHWASIWCRPIP